MKLTSWLDPIRYFVVAAARAPRRRPRLSSHPCASQAEVLQSRILLAAAVGDDVINEDDGGAATSTDAATSPADTGSQASTPAAQAGTDASDAESGSSPEESDPADGTQSGLDFISHQIDELLEAELPQPDVNVDQVEAALKLVANSPFPAAPIPSAAELPQAIVQVRKDVLTGNSTPTMTMQSGGFIALAPVGDGSGRVFGIVHGEARVWQPSDKLPPDEAAKWKEDNNLEPADAGDVYRGDGEEVTDKELRAAINRIVGYPTQFTSIHSLIGDLPGGEHVANDPQMMQGVALVLTGNAELMAEIEAMRMDGAGHLEAGVPRGIEGGTNAVIAVTLGIGLIGLVKFYKMIKAVPNAEEMVTNAAKSMTKEGIELLERKIANLEAAGDLTEATIRRSIDEVAAAGHVITPKIADLLTVSSRNLQKVFDKHGADFGLTGNWNPNRAADVLAAIRRHLNSSGTQAIQGVYRGQDVMHYVDPNTGLNVITDLSNNFIGGWKLGAAQLASVLSSGRLF